MERTFFTNSLCFLRSKDIVDSVLKKSKSVMAEVKESDTHTYRKNEPQLQWSFNEKREYNNNCTRCTEKNKHG